MNFSAISESMNSFSWNYVKAKGYGPSELIYIIEEDAKMDFYFISIHIESRHNVTASFFFLSILVFYWLFLLSSHFQWKLNGIKVSLSRLWTQFMLGA